MSKKDLHIHTTFSDGKNTAEEMVHTAIDLGLDEIGISDHSYTIFDESYCISKDRIGEYLSSIAELKEKYKGKIKVLCGVEQDYYSTEPTDGYDYVIGSVHYVFKDGKYIPVDESAEVLTDAVKKYYNGDFYAFAEDYFALVGEVVNKTGASIIGHFDLVSKFNEKNVLFDRKNERYRNAWKSAADKLLKTDAVFEINTGAISRGYKTEAYPSNEIMEYIRQNGGKFIFSSDAHAKENICFGFDKIKVKA